MSSRHLRKLKERLASLKDPPEADVEENHFEPLYASKPASDYSALKISSSSSDEQEHISDSSDEGEAAALPVKKNKNNRKKRNKNKRGQAGPSGTNSARGSSDGDEVAKVVAEVNQLLGEPKVPIQLPEPIPVRSLVLMKIDHKHLNIHNEMFRLFGPDENERGNRRLNLRHLKRQIVMTHETYKFTVKGLSMRLLETKDDIKYFKFEHGPEYQRNLHMLVDAMKHHFANTYMVAEELDVLPTNTIEALLQNTDLYYKLDETGIANNALEEIISFMQSISDPSFNYLDGKTRLEYCHVENRPFHIAVLKYLHSLTNKACHRTALELAKVLLNLDPSDPLGVIFIVDTLALRAREHQWLVDIFGEWAVDRDATCLFHLRYSYALAMYHLYLKNKSTEDLEAADFLIKYALVKFPNVALMLMKFCQKESPEIMNHEIFSTLVNNTTAPDLMNLQLLYAKFVWPKWREGKIMDWVIANALEVISSYETDPEMKVNVEKRAQERSQLFRKYPIEMKRHIQAINSMSNLLVDGVVPKVPKTPSFNPYPNQGPCIDVHRYYKDWGVVYPLDLTQRGLVRTFLESLIPELGLLLEDRDD